MIAVSTQRKAVVEAAYALSRLGLVTAYGHVSARAGASMLITPAADLATVTESTVVDVPLEASSLPMAAPAEAWAHLALYRARPDAGSIARAQPAGAVAAAAMTTSLTRCTDRPPGSANRSPFTTAPICCVRRISPSARPIACRPAKRCCSAETARSPSARHPASR